MTFFNKKKHNKKRTDKSNVRAGSEANNSATLTLYYNYLIIPSCLMFMLP